MRIKVLSSAIDDLYAGRLFYENQAEGVGSYFLTPFSLTSTLSLSMPESIRSFRATTVWGASPFLCSYAAHRY